MLYGAIACLIQIHGQAWAASGGVIELPSSPTGVMLYSKKSGIDLRIDTTWAGVHGYRPVTCRVTSQAPQQADKQIRIRFMAGNWRSDQPSMVVEKDFELPAGSMSASVTLSVPQYLNWRTVGCETFVDGVIDDELSDRQIPFSHSQSGHNFTAMLLDEIGGVSFRLFRDIRGAPAEVFSPTFDAQLGEWTEYSSMDVVVTTPADFKSRQKQSPERFQELVKWVRSGGNLWVISAESDFRDASEIENTLGLTEASSSAEYEFEALLKRGWRFPKLDNPASDALDKFSQLYSPQVIASEKDTLDPEMPEDSRQWFTTRPLGMGTVTLLMLPQTRSRQDVRELRWAITQSLLADRLSWDLRHGTDPDRGNDNFNDFLIPDVGAAPVTAFQVLLSLFVLGIGPVNYFLLKSREKLPLLLLTVPAAALATTLFLLIYSFTSEGFGTLVRARSFTLLDQKANSAVCWSRLSYYAGIAPSDGLEFPQDTLVYPILPSSRLSDRREMRRYAGQRREVIWDGSQQLTRGWLQSRTPTQYLTITSHDTEKQILFEPTQDKITAKNQLGVKILTLVVEDKEGKIFTGEMIDEGESLLLTPSTQIKAMLKLRTLLADNTPEFPAGTYESLSMGRGIDLLPFSQNLMETQLAAITSAVSQGWGPGTYIAVTDRGVDLSLGMNDINENSSFHVIRGVW
ncbi:MAG: hypothetical protein SH868_19830 [Bythopirellula sp.]|nr:hypothetical protein [Bythopirellula sp.]